MDCDKGVGAMYKKRYCEGDKTKCARYIVSTQCGPEFVTNRLYPNMDKKAQEILTQHKK